MPGVVLGIINWSGARNAEGHREYRITFRIESLHSHGPQTISHTPGLPQIGSFWRYGTDNDPWAFCTPELKITPVLTQENNRWWDIEYRFSTMPMPRCNATTIDNPLHEPQRVSGSFIKNRRSTPWDADDKLIRTVSFEDVEVERDESFPTLVIEQNDLQLGIDTFTEKVNKINNHNLWGLSPRKVKLDNVTWERKIWGICTFYFTRRYEFSINFDTWDRDDIPHRGRKVINGKWDKATLTWVIDGAADKTNPTHYMQAIDINGNPIETWLNPETGAPTSTPNYLKQSNDKPYVPIYQTTNFLPLGIPASLSALRTAVRRQT